jgi:type I restriction enzyme S subunit
MKYKLGQICEIVSGSTPKTSVEEYWDGDVKWITPAELSDNSYIIEDSVRKITELGVQKTGLTPFPKGTVILSSRAPIGKVAIAGCEMYCNQGFKNLICSEKVNNKYLFWFLKGKTEFLNALGRGATFKEISKSIVSDIEINVPNIEEQEKAVSVLEKIFQIINLRRKELSEFEKLIKARFVEMFGSCVNKVLIGDVISICRGASPRPIQAYITESLEGVNWIKIGDVSENSLYITKTAEKITLEGAKKSRAVHAGDFILSNSMSFGRPYILGIDGYVHDGWLILSNFRDTFNELYLYYALRNEYVQQQFHGKVNGATVKNLNSDLVKATYIQVPDMYSQKVFADFVKQTDKSKVAIQKSLAETQLLFDKLMQDYFG